MKKKKIILSIVVLLGITILPLPTKAVLQANPNTYGVKKDTSTNWMTNIRNMENANQAMGLEETINGTTKNSASGSNNIDVHMIKSTEFGAVAILSASGYGNPTTIQSSSIESTTGNKSGVYFSLAHEWVAGGLSGSIFSGVDAKYYNAYTSSNSSAKVGDALGTSSTANHGCAKWHSAPNDAWMSSGGPGLLRAESSLFNFTGYKTSWTALGRATVVCGEGF